MAHSTERSFLLSVCTDGQVAADEYDNRYRVAVRQPRRWRRCPWRARSACSSGTWSAWDWETYTCVHVFTSTLLCAARGARGAGAGTLSLRERVAVCARSAATGPALGVGQHVRRPRAQVRWGSKLKYVLCTTIDKPVYLIKHLNLIRYIYI
jgi:hypothetical protein